MHCEKSKFVQSKIPGKEAKYRAEQDEKKVEWETDEETVDWHGTMELSVLIDVHRHRQHCISFPQEQRKPYQH